MDTQSSPLPEGDYAIVELMGHRTLVGRISEVSRYGAALLQIEPIFQGRLLGPILHGGTGIYALTLCSAEVAAQRAPTDAAYLPRTVQAIVPPVAIAASDDDDDNLTDWLSPDDIYIENGLDGGGRD